MCAHEEVRGQLRSQFSSSTVWLLRIELGGELGVAASPLSAETSLGHFKSRLFPFCALCCFYRGEEVLSRDFVSSPWWSA